jgi:hypothetical protein
MANSQMISVESKGNQEQEINLGNKLAMMFEKRPTIEKAGVTRRVLPS